MGGGASRPSCQPNHKRTSAAAAYQSRLSRRCVLNQRSKRAARRWSVSWNSIHRGGVGGNKTTLADTSGRQTAQTQPIKGTSQAAACTNQGPRGRLAGGEGTVKSGRRVGMQNHRGGF